jgi:hypothetical protein
VWLMDAAELPASSQGPRIMTHVTGFPNSGGTRISAVAFCAYIL